MKTTPLGKARTFKFLFRIVLPVLVISACYVGLEGCAPPCYEVDFYPSNDTIVEGGSIVFTDNTLAEGDNYYWTYTWTFNGGIPASANTIGPHTVQYATSGIYSVNLTINGCDGDLEKTIQITVVAVSTQSPNAAFTVNVANINEGDGVDYTDQSTLSPTSWAWTFEGGTPATSTAQNPTDIVYATQGSYDVTLIATNANGSDTLVKTDYITVNPPAPYCSSVTDIDGNVYQVVDVGGSCWMKSNLKTSKYRNGTSIATGLSSTQWTNATTGAFTYFDGNASNNATYGKLYNWHAINSSNNICPTGWHPATKAEWLALIAATGGETMAGGALRSTTGWDAPNTGATNSSNFSALPGGFLNSSYEYNALGSQAYFWTSTSTGSDQASYLFLTNSSADIYNYDLPHNSGLSCRCVKD